MKQTNNTLREDYPNTITSYYDYALRHSVLSSNIILGLLKSSLGLIKDKEVKNTQKTTKTL